jgi:hypothetical protein
MGGVALGGGYSSGEDASDADENAGGYGSSSSGYDSGSDGEEAPQAVAAGRSSKPTHGRHKQRRQQQRDAAGSESDGGEAEPDVAYIGMARKSDKQQQRQQSKQQAAGSVAAGAAAAGASKQQQQQQQQQQGLSLAEQEAMALQLLAAKPW